MRVTRTALAVVAGGLAAGCGGGGTGGVTPTADPAAEVMRADARLNQITFPTGRDGAQLRAVLSEVNSIDTSRCPPDYQAAFAQLASAVGASVDYTIETGSWGNLAERGVEAFVRGFLGDPFGVAREDRGRRRQLQARLTEAVGQDQRTRAKYTT